MVKLILFVAFYFLVDHYEHQSYFELFLKNDDEGLNYVLVVEITYQLFIKDS